MRRKARAFLWDARQAVTKIEGFTEDRSLEEYVENPLVHSAVERQFEILGEALNQLSKTDPALAARIPDLPRIVAFRNLLIHGYAAIDHATVWRIVHENLPDLGSTLDRLLDEAGPSDG